MALSRKHLVTRGRIPLSPRNRGKITQMKKTIYAIIFLITVATGIYYFIPKKIRSCGALPSVQSCGIWKCERGFAISGIAKPSCLMGGEPVLQSSN